MTIFVIILQGTLEWDTVNSDQTRVWYDSLSVGNGEYYSFAVSANAENSSSGMVWESCMLATDKGTKNMNDHFPLDLNSLLLDILKVRCFFLL